MTRKHEREALGEGLLRDIATACRRYAAAIGDLGEEEVQPHRQLAVDFLNQLVDRVANELTRNETAGLDLIALSELGQPLDGFRRTRLPFFTHYGANERYLTLLAAQLSDEAGFPIATPLVGTFSNRGYWTIPEVRTLCVPAGEQSQLLAFPDLVHELGHLLIHEVGGALSAEFFRDVLGPYTQNLGPIDGDRQFGSRLYRRYQQWHIEFVADAVAAYVCGPAYGWQHIRLNAQIGTITDLSFQRPWYPGSPGQDRDRLTHPADTARTTTMALVLDRTGHRDQATRLLQHWRSLTSRAGPPPPSYAITYPDHVLGGLIRITLKWCYDNGVVPFTDAPANTIVKYIDRAWNLQLSDPVAFASAEAQLVAELRALVDQRTA